MKKNVFARIAMLALALMLVCANALAVTEEEAVQAARAVVPADAQYTRTERDDGLFEVKFTSGDEKLEVKVDPDSGKVISLDGEVKGARGSESAALSEAQVLSAVQAVYPGAKLVRFDERRDDGAMEIDAFFTADGVYGTLELNAQTGALLERKVYFGDYLSGDLLTGDAASAALTAAKPGVVITKLELDEDDGAYYWEGDAQLDGKRYEFELDAATGRLIEWERD